MSAPLTLIRTTTSGACAACGAYGDTQHSSTCQPGRRFALGRMRRARRDCRTSALVREQERLQQSLGRDL